MKFILDTANLDKIEHYLSYLPVDGVTSNPSILRAEGQIDVAAHMREIRSLIGPDRSLHVQTIQSDTEGMLADAYKILESIDDKVFIKVPVSEDGLAAIKRLKADGVNVTATAIYSKIQAMLAMGVGADFLAPYVNRMENLNSCPYDLIQTISRLIDKEESHSRIVAASFKNVAQVTRAIEAGASHVTVGSDVLDRFLANSNITTAVEDFARDWYMVHEKDHF